MIFFNNIALESIAPVKIEDIRVSPIQMTAVTRPRPLRFGADFVRITGGSRTAAITFALLTNNRDARQQQLKQITRWARSQEEGRLELPNHSGLYLSCVCTEFPEPSLRQWWESKLRLVFTAYDNPYWTDSAEKTAACGAPFIVAGDAPPLMRIQNTLSVPAGAQAYSNGAETMTFSTVPAGDLLIDLNRQTAAVNGQNIMQYYSFDSSFLKPKTGSQTITGAGSVKWRERWE